MTCRRKPGRVRGRPWLLRTAIGFLLLAAAGGGSRLDAQSGPVPERLDILQRIARSDLVVLVQVTSGDLKYALVDTVEVFKGTAPGTKIRIAFRDFNFTHQAGEDPIVFPAGQKEILFLVPDRVPRKKKDIEKFKDLFTLFKGRQGRITLPAEGGDVLIVAMRHLARTAGLDAASMVEALKDDLRSVNPYVLGNSLAEIERLHVDEPELLERLSPLLRSPSPDERGSALRIIAHIFRSRSAGDLAPLDDWRSTLASVMERARNDSSETVRVEAVRGIAAWPARKDVEGDLRGIADGDRSQEVRFEAQRALLVGK